MQTNACDNKESNRNIFAKKPCNSFLWIILLHDGLPNQNLQAETRPPLNFCNESMCIKCVSISTSRIGTQDGLVYGWVSHIWNKKFNSILSANVGNCHTYDGTSMVQEVGRHALFRDAEGLYSC